MVALRLGQKVHVGRYEAHLFGEFAKTVGSEVGKGYGRKIIQKAAFVTLGELSPEGAGHGGGGDHQENGLEDRDQIAGTIKTLASDSGGFFDKGASGAEGWLNL